MTDGETASTLQPINASAIPQRHRAFSLSRILAITGNTLTELTRLKVFYVLLVFGLLLIGSSIFMAQFSFQQEFQILKDVSLGAISMFTSLLAIVATARMLPRDIEDRTVYTILAKPVPRFEYVVGKIAGVLVLLAISTLVMVAAFLAVLYLREQAVLQATAKQMAGAPPDQLADALRAVRASAFNADLVPGIIIIFLKACLLTALTLFVSTFATSTIFTIVVMVFIYFIGHLEATAREYWLTFHGGGLDHYTLRCIVAEVDDVVPDGDKWAVRSEGADRAASLHQTQECAIDALALPDIDVVALTGKAGTGKTLLALAAGIEQTAEFRGPRPPAERAGYEQVMVARPIVPLTLGRRRRSGRGGAYRGAVPGCRQ